MLSNVPIALSPPLARTLVSGQSGALVRCAPPGARAPEPQNVRPAARCAEHHRDVDGAEHGSNPPSDGQAERDQSRRSGRLGPELASQGRRAWADGRLAEDSRRPSYVVTDGGRRVVRDNHIRRTQLERLAELRPVFDREYGTRSRGQLEPAHPMALPVCC